jgi:hypothetical protein
VPGVEELSVVDRPSDVFSSSGIKGPDGAGSGSGNSIRSSSDRAWGVPYAEETPEGNVGVGVRIMPPTIAGSGKLIPEPSEMSLVDRRSSSWGRDLTFSSDPGTVSV